MRNTTLIFLSVLTLAACQWDRLPDSGKRGATSPIEGTAFLKLCQKLDDGSKLDPDTEATLLLLMSVAGQFECKNAATALAAMTELNLSGRPEPAQTIDVAVFALLPKLESLTLSGFRVKDVSPLSNLENLKYLDLTSTGFNQVLVETNVERLRFASLERLRLTIPGSMTKSRLVLYRQFAKRAADKNVKAVLATIDQGAIYEALKSIDPKELEAKKKAEEGSLKHLGLFADYRVIAHPGDPMIAVLEYSRGFVLDLALTAADTPEDHLLQSWAADGMGNTWKTSTSGPVIQIDITRTTAEITETERKGAVAKEEAE